MLFQFLIVATLICLPLFAAAASAEQPSQALIVPPDFVIERVAGEPQVRFPMFAAFDDHGRLYVAESSGLDLYAELVAQTRRCRIVRLEDRDGDGSFETSQVFADKLVFPMGLAWREGRLYVADPPDLVVYEDKDNDGRGDRREVILTGFGHTDNGSLHGLEFGPDGWLYMTMGNPDSYRLRRRDGSILAGTNGALFRVRPDGSDPQVICRGFTNLVEVSFLPDGTIIGSDNFFQMPSGGLRDALVHLVEGGLYPLNSYQDETRFVVTGELLPPVTRLPTTGISGLVRYRGNAFPDQMRGNLFSAQHNTRKVQRHVLVAQDSTWISEDIDFVTTDDPDFHPSDVIEDVDGSLLILDTGAWYVQHCPTGRIRQSTSTGGIYRTQHFGKHQPIGTERKHVEWSACSVDALLDYLPNAPALIAEQVERELERREVDVAAAIDHWAKTRPIDEATLRAAWVLVRRGDQESLGVLREFLGSDNNQLAAVAARGVALASDHPSSEQLARML